MDPTIPWLAELRQSSESWASCRGTRKAIPVHNDIFSSPFHELFTFWNSDVHLGSLILCASSSEVPWALLPVYKPHLYLPPRPLISKSELQCFTSSRMYTGDMRVLFCLIQWERGSTRDSAFPASSQVPPHILSKAQTGSSRGFFTPRGH